MLSYSSSSTSAKQLSQITVTVKGHSSNDIDDGLDAADLDPDAENLDKGGHEADDLDTDDLDADDPDADDPDEDDLDATLTWMTLSGC